MESRSGFHTLLTGESPYSPLLNAILIIFFTTLALTMIYSFQVEINTEVAKFRLAALPYSLRLAFARTRLKNAKCRLYQTYLRICPDEQARYLKVVQTRREILEYVEEEAKEPLKALAQAEKYRLWWWTGLVDVPVLKLYVDGDVNVLEMDSDDEGYWFSDEED